MPSLPLLRRQPLFRGNPAVRGLPPNYREVESDNYCRTHIFPIMHGVAIRNDILERYPWVARNL